MRSETMTCDRCGRQQTGVVRWDEAIKAVSVKCPPDGINGGVYSPDLCELCRRGLDRVVSEYLSKEAPHA